MGRSGSSSQRDRRVQPPRPPNAWILYRSYQFKQIRATNERLSQATVSKLISDMWRNETEDVKRHFEQEAEKKKAQHQELYPDYRFCPKRKERKLNRKKSKCRDATPSDDEEDDDDPPMPTFLPRLNMQQPQPHTQPFLAPGYHLNMVTPQPFMIPYLPEAHYGPGGPSPPMSSAPSPSRYQGSASPVQPALVENVASSSSSPSTRPSSSSQSQASSSSSQLLAHPTYLPSLPNSLYPSPNPYVTQPLSALLFQNSTLSEVPLTSPRLQLRSTENTGASAVPAWNNISTYLSSLDPQNSEEVVNLDLAISQTPKSAELQQAISVTSSFDSFQGLLSRTDETGIFNLSNIESSGLLNHPNGDLEVVLGPEAPTVDYPEDLFADFDFDEFERQMDSLREDGSSSVSTTSCSVEEDLQALFRVPDNPEYETYAVVRQRQPSIFTQDMMNFLNFDAAENSTEVTASAASPGAAVPPTVAPQQVRLQSPQVAASTTIFTQMTNAPTVASGTLYVPPAGAIYSSTRRVGGSWKPSSMAPGSQMEDPVPSWTL